MVNYGKALDVFYEPVKIMVYPKLILFKHIKEKNTKQTRKNFRHRHFFVSTDEIYAI